MNWKLSPHHTLSRPKGPVVCVILDGVGIGLGDESDAVALARTPTLDSLRAHSLSGALFAHGTHVGLPSDDDMGNSEVGHNALGCGRVHDQGALLVDKAIASGSLFKGEAWTEVARRGAAGRTIHFIGLLSDGNVHSHIQQLFALCRRASESGCKSIAFHPLLDGRDVPPRSALTYVDALEGEIQALREAGVDARVASGGGRMTTTMDRYEADWGMVERGFRAHVHGQAKYHFGSLREAVEELRNQHPDTIDQDLPTFVIVDDEGPVGCIRDGDAVVLFNFRGDRAIEISQAFEDKDFPHFERDLPDVYFAGMMEYDGDLHVPKHYLVPPPSIMETMGEFLVHNSVHQLAISETQKYGHVTFFWNGNRSGKFDEKLETYVEIPSDVHPFQERPWMKAAEITDRLIAELSTGKHGFARVNYANGDMVGHTGHLEATITAVQVVDLQVARLVKAVERLGGALVITADHGNADEMYQHDKSGNILKDSVSGAPMAKTSHTLNTVPIWIHAPQHRGRYRLETEGAGISSVTATCFELLGFEPPANLSPSLLSFS